MRSLALDRGKRLSEGTLVKAHVEGRVLGLRLLKIDALVALVPASPPEPASDAWLEPGRSISSVGNGSAVPGSALAEAVRTLDEAAVLLADDRRNGSN
jgi:hypothetical protein